KTSPTCVAAGTYHVGHGASDVRGVQPGVRAIPGSLFVSSVGADRAATGCGLVGVASAASIRLGPGGHRRGADADERLRPDARPRLRMRAVRLRLLVSPPLFSGETSPWSFAYSRLRSPRSTPRSSL